MNFSSFLPSMPYQVRELWDKATNIVMNYSETETKVIEATNDESWGPAGTILQELSQLSYSNQHYNEMMGMIWKRCLGQDPRYWRRIYKSLLLLNYLIKNGNERVLTSIREHLFDLRSLESFAYRDENGKDQGINVRHKIKEMIEFIQDDDRIREERKRAKATRDKYVGMSHESPNYRYRNDDHDDFRKEKINRSKTEENFRRKISNSEEKITNRQETSIKSEPPPPPPPLLVDLLGDDDFTPFVQAASPPPAEPSLLSFDPFLPTEPISTPSAPTTTTTMMNNSNIWSSVQGHLDISLNNLIPHTRGDPPKTSVPLNQMIKSNRT